MLSPSVTKSMIRFGSGPSKPSLNACHVAPTSSVNWAPWPNVPANRRPLCM